MRNVFFFCCWLIYVNSQVNFVIEFKTDIPKFKNNNIMTDIVQQADIQILGEPKAALRSISEPIVGVNFIPGVCQAGWFWENEKCNKCPCNVTVSNVTTIRFFSLI